MHSLPNDRHPVRSSPLPQARTVLKFLWSFHSVPRQSSEATHVPKSEQSSAVRLGSAYIDKCTNSDLAELNFLKKTTIALSKTSVRKVLVLFNGTAQRCCVVLCCVHRTRVLYPISVIRAGRSENRCIKSLGMITQGVPPETPRKFRIFNLLSRI
jgi:hypothetical protein